jgi:uncharacterized damage-inducible protein DinB
MDIRQLIDQYAAYDLWANTRIAERLSREDEALLDVPVKSSFPSLRGTLMHIRNSECIWLDRLLERAPRWPAEAHEGFDTFLQHIITMRDHVRSLGEKELVGTVEYKDLRGNVHRQQRLQILMHCFNHSSYHRGQLVTIMRQLDLTDIPAMDLVVYQRLQSTG